MWSKESLSSRRKNEHWKNLEMGFVNIPLGLIRDLAVRIGTHGGCIYFEMVQGETYQVSMEVQLPAGVCSSSSALRSPVSSMVKRLGPFHPELPCVVVLCVPAQGPGCPLPESLSVPAETTTQGLHSCHVSFAPSLRCRSRRQQQIDSQLMYGLG